MATVDDDTMDNIMRMLDMLFRDARTVTRLEILQAAEVMELSDDMQALFALLPPGRYTRPRLADQFNSIVVGHGLGNQLGRVQ